MAIGKMITALWLVRFSTNPLTCLVSILKRPFAYGQSCSSKPQATSKPSKREKNSSKKTEGRNRTETGGISSPDDANQNEPRTTNEPSATNPNPNLRSRPQMSLPPKPKSLYPPFILGLAMVARGEVGYLIASIAESQGMFSGSSSEGSSDIYLVVIWAISLCTLIGPVLVGTLVRRVKKLQQSRKDSGSGTDPLGVWGI